MTYQIEEIYSLLDAIPNDGYKQITLPRSDIKIVINGKKNKIVNAFYLRSKEGEVIQCSCCGVVPSHLEFSYSHGLRMVISEKNYMTLDHVIPRSKGGLSTRENLTPMCFECNNKKADILDLKNVKEVFEISDVFGQLIKRFRNYKRVLQNLKSKLFAKGIFGIIDREMFKEKVFTEIKKIVPIFELNQIRPKLVQA